MKAVQTPQMHGLWVRDVTLHEEWSESFIQFAGTIGNVGGKSKCTKDGTSAASAKPVYIFIWNRNQVNETINVFEDLKGQYCFLCFNTPLAHFFVQ